MTTPERRLLVADVVIRRAVDVLNECRRLGTDAGDCEDRVRELLRDALGLLTPPKTAPLKINGVETRQYPLSDTPA